MSALPLVDLLHEFDSERVADLGWQRANPHEKARLLRVAASVLGEHDIIPAADKLFEKSLEMERAA